MTEHMPSAEEIDLRGLAIKALLEFSRGGEEFKEAAMESVAQWARGQEEARSSRDSVKQGDFYIALEYARIYDEGGLKDYVIEAYEDALRIAASRRNVSITVTDSIKDRIAELRASL